MARIPDGGGAGGSVPFARLRGSTQGALVAGVQTPVVWNAQDFLVGGFTVGGGNTNLLVPIDGFYTVQVGIRTNVGAAPATGARKVVILGAGGTVNMGEQDIVLPGTVDQVLQAHGSWRLLAGQSIQIQVRLPDNGVLNSNDHSMFLEAIFVSAET